MPIFIISGKSARLRIDMGQLSSTDVNPQVNLRMPYFPWSGISMGDIMMKA